LHTLFSLLKETFDIFKFIATKTLMVLWESFLLDAIIFKN